PFARYALACLGQDDFASVLASQPGAFLAIRSRTQIAAERFRQRKASAAEMLDALRLAGSHGFSLAAGDHLYEIATMLAQRSVTAAQLRAFVGDDSKGEPAFRNRLRIAVEMATRDLPVEPALELLLEWSKAEILGSDEPLRRSLGQE